MQRWPVQLRRVHHLEISPDLAGRFVAGLILLGPPHFDPRMRSFDICLLLRHEACHSERIAGRLPFSLVVILALG